MHAVMTTDDATALRQYVAIKMTNFDVNDRGLAGPCMAARGRTATACTPALVHLSGTTGAGCWARRRGDRPPMSGLMKVLFRDRFLNRRPETVGAAA